MHEAAAARYVAGGLTPGHPRHLAATLARFVHWSCVGMAVVVLGGISVLSILGFRLMVVTSNSMTPRFGPGDAVVVRPTGAEGVRVGDVITYRITGVQGMTTHRVIGIRSVGGETSFETQGDANATPDANPVPAESVYGRQLLTLPRVGRLLLVAVSPLGKLLMLGFPVFYLMAGEISDLLALRRVARSGPSLRS